MSANRDSTFCNAEGPKGAKLALRKMPGLHKEKCEEKKKKEAVLRNFCWIKAEKYFKPH